MGKDFLGALAGAISSQFSLGENTNHTLDAVDIDTGKNVKYGSLGDFAQHFDQSAERKYVEEGYLRIDPFTTSPKQFEILMQEPTATVLVKKKMFSSVGDNFRPDFMDADEKVYYKAMRVLFQNKCAQIAALEKLSKIQQITDSMGSVSEQLMPIIFSLSDSISSGFSTPFGGSSNPLQNAASSFSKTIDNLRKVYGFNRTSKVTSWITDSTNLFQSQFGQGTGTIEITNFTSLTTTTSTDSLGSPGTFSITISDPYEAMLITEWDIEKAISDATNMFYNSKINQFAKESSTTLINDLTVRLNNTRAARNASPISLKISPETLLGKRVTAIFDRLGIELPFDYDSTSAASIFSGGAFGGGATIPPEYLKGGEIAGNDGLDPQKKKFFNIRTKHNQQKRTHEGRDSEVSLFSRLISTIYSKLSQDANSQAAFVFNNAKNNYARKKLRFNFSGKLIIQPMDVVHIYMNSKSRFDTKLLSGLNNMFSGVGMLQNLNNTLTGLKTSFNTLFNPSGDIPLQIEKAAFVGSDFPNSLWSLVRGQFVSENEGTHVFAGVVETASDQWSDGKFTVSIGGKDNTFYFEQGKVNFKPGVDVYAGKMFDPLTPFKSSFDTISSTYSNDTPELLPENKFLLGASEGEKRSGLVKSKLGRYAGMLVNEADVINDRSVDPVTGRVTNVFYAPDGLVYKWKEGIGIFTQFGSNLSMNDASRVGNPNIANEPFAGQDVMNVLSLLITGVPYNFATYYKATQNFDGAAPNPQSKENAAHAFSLSLRNDLVKSNTLWGNFIPFKNLVLDESSYVLALNTQTSIINKNRELDRQIRELKELNNKAMMSNAINVLSPTTTNGIDNSDFNTVQEQYKILDAQVQESMKAIDAENKKFHAASGNFDTSFDSTDFTDVDYGDKSVSNAALNRNVRRQINFLTRRMSYNVRANDDKNLFIVDDTYDKDNDILAFEKSLTDGIKLYNNEFTDVKEKISGVAQLLNLEVFCDSQGHIRVRSPQYNRMPSSVFYKMMHLKETLSIQIFPEFLNNLFKSKLDNLRTRLEILEDQIRLDGAVLDMNTDDEVIQFTRNNLGTFSLGSGFAFISDENGAVTKIDNLIKAANPDAPAGDKNSFNKIEVQAAFIQDVFTNSQKYSALTQALNVQAVNAKGISTVSPKFLSSDNTRVNDLVKRINTKSGLRVDKKDYLINSDAQIVIVQAPLGTQIDLFKVVEEMSTKLREHQKVLKLFYNTIKNAREFRYLDDKSNSGNSLITAPSGYNNSNIPEVFEHMIEDETYDDYGIGSGSRYIIKRSQIKSINIAENPPPATMITVQGIFDPQLPNISNEGFNALSPGGNGLTQAVAIDYDMWRSYGFKNPATVNVPFLKDPATQCGPYAAMLLSRNRKNILRGTAVISGNEFMQPGEVVFIEDRGLLFYVTSVQHSFTFGSSFQTTLTLTYGHTPGEYIPTPMDMIGKMLYNNKDVAELAVERQETSSNDINIGVLQLDIGAGISKSLGTGDNAKDPPSALSASNAQTISNIIYTTAYQLTSNFEKGNDVVAKIQLRTYCDNNSKGGNATLLKFANEVRNSLISGAGFGSGVVKKGVEPKPMDAKDIKETTETIINLEDASDRRSPSQKAIDAARNFVAQGKKSSLSSTDSTDTGKDKGNKIEQDAIRKALFSNVVDCWISINLKESEGC